MRSGTSSPSTTTLAVSVGMQSETMVARRHGDGGLELAPRHLERAPKHEVLEHLGVADDPAAAIAVGQQAARVDAHEAVHDVVAVRGVLER